MTRTALIITPFILAAASSIPFIIPQKQPTIEETFTPAFNRPKFPLVPRKPLNHRQKLIQKIKDYTVNIVLYGFSGGTGWFLDHEIPKDNRYPTKWFLATNAHVIKNHTFPSHFHLHKWESGGYDEELFRKANIDFEDPLFWTWDNAKRYHPNYSNKIPPSRDAEKSSKHWHRRLETPLMKVKIPNPKLLYVSLETKDNIHIFKDFAVIEVDFPNEISAKRMTQQIFNRPKEERINFMDDFNESSLFYTAGYPNNSYNPFRPFGNYSFSRNIASKKQKCHPLSSTHHFDWKEIRYTNPHCYHPIDNFWSGPGASGSMVIDESSTILGLVSMGVKGDHTAYVQPLRNKSINNSLEYDLINGSPNQQTSYRQQLLKKLPNINTYLKQEYNWK